MAYAEGKILINKPVQEVFDFLLDGENNKAWRPAVVDIQRVSEKVRGVGAAFKQGLKGPGGKRIDGDYEIVECIPNELIKFKVTAGPARPTGIFQFDNHGGSTEVTFELKFQPKGFAKLFDPMISKQMRKEISTLSNLKKHLEEMK